MQRGIWVNGFGVSFHRRRAPVNIKFRGPASDDGARAIELAQVFSVFDNRAMPVRRP